MPLQTDTPAAATGHIKQGNYSFFIFFNFLFFLPNDLHSIFLYQKEILCCNPKVLARPLWSTKACPSTAFVGSHNQRMQPLNWDTANE